MKILIITNDIDIPDGLISTIFSLAETMPFKVELDKYDSERLLKTSNGLEVYHASNMYDGKVLLDSCEYGDMALISMSMPLLNEFQEYGLAGISLVQYIRLLDIKVEYTIISNDVSTVAELGIHELSDVNHILISDECRMRDVIKNIVGCSQL